MGVKYVFLKGPLKSRARRRLAIKSVRVAFLQIWPSQIPALAVVRSVRNTRVRDNRHALARDDLTELCAHSRNRTSAVNQALLRRARKSLAALSREHRQSVTAFFLGMCASVIRTRGIYRVGTSFGCFSVTFRGLTERGRGSFRFNDRPWRFRPGARDSRISAPRVRYRDFFSTE